MDSRTGRRHEARDTGSDLIRVRDQIRYRELQGDAMKLAIPDLISNSYFPALAAAELGFFEREGIDVTAELIFPVDRAYEALRDGAVDFVGGAAHGALAAFTEW